MRTFILTLLLCLCFLPGSAQSNWKIGVRAGLTGIPYTLSSGRLGTGMLAGLYLEPIAAKATTYSLSLNYRKVDNLLKERLVQSIVVLPDGLYRGSELLSVSGFTDLSVGIRFDQVIRNFQKGKLKVSIEGAVGAMTVVRARQQSVVALDEFDSALVETGVGSFLSQPNSVRSTSSSRVAEDEGKLLFSGGVGMLYEFAAGLQLTCSVQLDMNDRFSQFTGTSDAKLTQVIIGFNYPFSTKIK